MLKNNLSGLAKQPSRQSMEAAKRITEVLQKSNSQQKPLCLLGAKRSAQERVSLTPAGNNLKFTKQ